LGAAHLRQLDQAKAESARLTQLESATVAMREDLFARNIRMLRLELEAWIAHMEGKEEASVSLMREAADLEESTPKAPVTPGPTLPAEELLGDLLMEQKQPAKALPAYQRSLELYPHRRHSVLGAARAAALTGDLALSGIYSREVEKNSRR
jgi:tetratricopeptide (TPR) repeat protein